jgi:hypothetical protein
LNAVAARAVFLLFVILTVPLQQSAPPQPEFVITTLQIQNSAAMLTFTA